MFKRLTFFSLFIFFVSLQTFAQQQNFWTEHGIGALSISKAAARSSFPTNYKLFDANLSSMQQYLLSAARTKSSQIRLTLPNADGMMEEYELTEASNFEPELQARYSEIRSFSGKGITDKNARLKLSISPQGVQTIVFREGKEEEYIEPYSEDNLTYSVFKSQRKTGQLPWMCSTVDNQLVSALNQIITDQPIGIARSGGNLKILRLALSCNGEYANYFGATTTTPDREARVLAAYNATLTRCNGIFEKDLAIHLNLIPTTTAVIYYDPATDPYSPSAALSAWNGQLQATLTSIIGDANYDIGHMFGSTGGGGNAGCIGCVCNAGKGSGITSPADNIPQGDNFDIDYVAHEIGHQLGANHTFSMSNEGTGVNKEVGSGITIMGYAGITSQDVAPHSIDIFHQASIEQIQNNIATKTCGSTLAIGANNTTPVVAPLTNYTIPRSTPFFLTGSATDADGDALTYVWEQNDNGTIATTGTASVASATKVTGPNWISFRPTSSPTRYFPQLSTILAGQNVTGPLPGGDLRANIEALSSVARTLNFRLTVRDNAPYSSTLPEVGQTSFADVRVTVASTGPFSVTAPNTNVSWSAGSSQNITWAVGSSNVAPVNCANVKISLSTDGGQTFPIVLAESTPNDGSHPIVVPNNVTTSARIKIEAVGNIFFDISNRNFNITSTTATCGNPTGLTTSGITTTNANLSWTAVANATSYAVEYKLNTAATWTVFNAAQTTTTASLTGLTTGTAYNWRVRATCATSVGAYVTANFTTTTACANPTGLTSSGITTTNANLSWTAVTNATSYAVEYKLNTATTWTVINTAQITTTASLTGLTAGTTYNWRVRATCAAGTGAFITANFTTTAIVTSCQSPLDNASNGTTAGAAIIPFNTNVTGLISPASDIDYYRFAITRAGRITISLSTLPANYNVRLRNAAGTQVAIAQRTGTRNESFNYNAAIGTYYVEVYGANAAANNATRCYTLRVALRTAARNNTEIRRDETLSIEAGQVINESEASQAVELFPNPVSNELMVKLIALEGRSVIEVFDLTGKKVVSTTVNAKAGSISTTKIDMSKNTKGIYLVRITNNNTIVHQSKIIKQ